ncbi:MAG: MarR family transcriptional regulator [Fusobacteriales bacterium]|jgi:DNA-binding MarR family transcriptional regulator|nr:MarR family transcriptional regulator [Fusobacteriales bacterium]
MKLADIIEILSTRFLNYKICELEKYNAQNISVNFFQYIDIIGNMGTPTYGELAQELNLSKPAITAIVNKLIKQNLVYKEQSMTDKRTFYIKLTKNGLEIFNSCRMAHNDLEKYIAEKLTEDEYNQLVHLLCLVIE